MPFVKRPTSDSRAFRLLSPGMTRCARHRATQPLSARARATATRLPRFARNDVWENRMTLRQIPKAFPFSQIRCVFRRAGCKRGRLHGRVFEISAFGGEPVAGSGNGDFRRIEMPGGRTPGLLTRHSECDNFHQPKTGRVISAALHGRFMGNEPGIIRSSAGSPAKCRKPIPTR